MTARVNTYDPRCGSCGAPLYDLSEGRGAAGPVWVHNLSERTRSQALDIDHQPTLSARAETVLPEIPEGDRVLPVGQLEIGALLGVTRETVGKWRQRPYLRFPPHRWIVGGDPCWAWSDVAWWAWDSGRLDTMPDSPRLTQQV